jgi:putative cell wall-binding protein
MSQTRRSVVRSLVGTVAALAIAASGLVALGSPAIAADSSASISGADFQAGYIISDDAFYDSNGMSEEEIQAFLDSKVPVCGNWNCLTFMRTDTFDRVDARGICAPYLGARGELAATIIYKVQRACGISARVLLVTLQKEQSLVTATAPSESKLARAMGYGCPDSANGACDERYYGLYNQLYMAAWQFKRYSYPDRWGRHQPGTMEVATHPNTACPTQTVTIRNNATAALYNYTPYTPNAAALGNLRGTGDSCSSYGNRNFWVFYNDWFGNPLVTYPAGVTADRIGGSDRYEVAVTISKNNFPNSVSTVYVATGANYPDALSAAPAAAAAGAPLLLVPSTALPASVADEIRRLAPTKIVVVGGPSSVSPAVYDQLATLTTTIQRQTGVDRYEVSRNLAAGAFASGSTVAYLATGATYPDALSASAAAGAIDAPVVLVNGVASLDAETAALMTTLGVTEIRIAGGPSSVTPALEAELKAIPGVTTVRRMSGEDRYIVSGVINRQAFTASSQVYLASGLNFPDALSGAAVAGIQNAPLYVIPSTCIPSYVLQDIATLKATKMTILGGPATVGPDVMRVAQCR